MGRRQAIRTVRAIALAASLLLVVAACGQKPGVRVNEIVGGGGGAAGGGDVAGGAGTGGTTDATGGGTAEGQAGTSGGTAGGTAAGGSGTGGDVAAGDGGGGGQAGTGGSADAGTNGGGTNGGGTDGAQGGDGGGGTSGGGGGQQPQGSDRTGVADDSITFGLHAPVTGAAPLPVTSFEKSGDIYYRWVADQGGDFLGRKKINLIFRDDKYDPNSAVQVCRELASKTFALGGGGGTDQIQACGRYADQANVPYFSAGVTEAGLKGLDWYFASSMSYRAQGVLLAQMVKKKFPNKKAAAIITDTPNFDDAVQGWEQGVQQQGLNYYGTLRHPKGDSSWYNSFASELNRNGVELVYILTAPVDYIRFAQQAHQQGFKPQFVGVGVSMGLNAVLGSGCDEVDGGIFFSPFPGLDWAQQNVPDFFKAGEKYDAPTDDIALALWGTAKINHLLLQRYGEVFGNDLTREDFRAIVEQQDNIESGVFPTVSYSPENHFGSNAVHVLQADCASGQHKTLHTFTSGF